MGLIIQNSKIQQKVSYIPGVVPTIPASGSTDHTDGTWIDTDIYIGEFFINVTDEKAYYRGVTGIQQIYPYSAGTSQDVYIYPTYGDFSGTTGAVDKLYIAKDISGTFYWNSVSSSYIQLASVASVEWSNILNGTTSLPSEIDASVAATHGVDDVNASHYTKVENDAAAGTPGAKQDKEAGKGLSTNDFDNYYKGLLDNGIQQVIIADNYGDFPVTGSTEILYVARLTKEIYVYNQFIPGYELIITGTDTNTYTTGATLSGSVATFERNDGNTYDLQLSGLTGSDTLTGLTDVNVTSLTDLDVLNYDLASGKWINTQITRTEGDDHYILWRDQQTNTNKTTSLQHNEANGRMFLAPGIAAAMNNDYSFGIQDKITNTQATGGQINLEGINILVQGSQIGDTGGHIYGMKVEAYPRKNDDVSAGVYIQSGFQLYGEQYPLQIETPAMGTGKVLTCIDGVTGYAEWADAPVVVSALSGLTDVSYRLPLNDGEVLTYSSAGYWENRAVSSGGDTLWGTGSTGDFSIKAINDSGTDATGYYAFAVGNNTYATKSHSIAMGRSALVQGDGINGAVIGGTDCTVMGESSATIGGDTNTIGDGFALSFIGAGTSNIINSAQSAILGGMGNTVNNLRSIILGGNGITTTADDTTYVSNLNINVTPATSTSNEILTREADGSITVKIDTYAPTKTKITGLTGTTEIYIVANGDFDGITEHIYSCYNSVGDKIVGKLLVNTSDENRLTYADYGTQAIGNCSGISMSVEVYSVNQNVVKANITSGTWTVNLHSILYA